MNTPLYIYLQNKNKSLTQRKPRCFHDVFYKFNTKVKRCFFLLFFLINQNSTETTYHPKRIPRSSTCRRHSDESLMNVMRNVADENNFLRYTGIDPDMLPNLLPVPSSDVSKSINRFNHSIQSFDSINRFNRSIQSIDSINRFNHSIKSIDSINRFNQSIQSID